ncbi:MAG: hypothetical protein IKB02_01575 [Clostridia bacterium]|nr:hypothetical protein [Clostridia bacterium]
MEEIKNRKTTRLRGADYNRNGAVFLTICTKERRCILSRIVGTGVPDGPYDVELLPYGKIADKYINQLNDFYDDLSVESYVIMLIIFIFYCGLKAMKMDRRGRRSLQRSKTLSLRDFCQRSNVFATKNTEKNIWQYRSNDHIIRNREDYEEHLRYIHENPMRWFYDELYAEE